MHRLLIGVIGFFFFSFTYARKGFDGHFEKRATVSDTTYKDDSLAVIASQVHDPKQDFKNLFISDQSSGNISLRQLNPQAISFVEDYADKYGEEIEDIKEWGKPYLILIENILEQHGLPKELKYLAVVESNLKSNARSWVGAVGPWQFMPATARNMGLRVNGNYDERKDFSKSTHAAAKYLSSLYDLYGDWLLVIAAYNGGAGKVNSAIKKSGSKDFWTLQRFLPTESKNHVKKFIATHFIMEGQGSIATATKAESKNMTTSTALTPEEMENSKTQNISGRYNSLVITKYIAMDIVSFNKMNPDFDRMVASGNDYEMRLPNEKMELFISKKPEILNESMQLLLSAANN